MHEMSHPVQYCIGVTGALVVASWPKPSKLIAPYWFNVWQYRSFSLSTLLQTASNCDNYHQLETQQALFRALQSAIPSDTTDTVRVDQIETDCDISLF